MRYKRKSKLQSSAILAVNKVYLQWFNIRFHFWLEILYGWTVRVTAVNIREKVQGAKVLIANQMAIFSPSGAKTHPKHALYPNRKVLRTLFLQIFLTFIPFHSNTI